MSVFNEDMRVIIPAITQLLNGKLVLYQVDAERMYADGYEFFVSVNGVWLTKEVPVKYLVKV